MKALAKDLYIKHFQYGCGVVTESDSEHTRIDFDLHGMKLFMTGLMVVEPAEGTPPKRVRRRKKAVPGAPVVTKALSPKAAAKAAAKLAAKPATDTKTEAKAAVGAK